jgi:8-oxo-dGTP diphosphatase
VEPRRVDCVGGVVTDPAGRLLLIQRGKEPALGCWSVPGGRVEPGETLVEAVLREVREEAGIEVVGEDLVGVVERAAPDGSVYVIYDFACTPAGPLDVLAGDDADDAGWFTADEVRRLECSPGLVDAFVEWGVLPAESG